MGVIRESFVNGPLGEEGYKRSSFGDVDPALQVWITNIELAVRCHDLPELSCRLAQDRIGSEHASVRRILKTRGAYVQEAKLEVAQEFVK